jgi:hypothetical protein
MKLSPELERLRARLIKTRPQAVNINPTPEEWRKRAIRLVEIIEQQKP